MNYSYTGAVQTVTLQPGKYQLECWGGNGGDAHAESSGYNYQAGGIGGYSKGEIDIKTATTYYLYVGGRGQDAQASGKTAVGGYNGGGSATTTKVSYTSAAGGGGTDVRTTQNDNYRNRIIVAGGGGGAKSYSICGAFNGGGQTSQGKTAGTLSSNIGKGADTSVTNVRSASGGGYYGGVSQTINNITNVGDGGNGYVGGVLNGLTVQPTESGYIANPDTNGNGFIRITILNLYSAVTIVYDDNTMGCDSKNSNVEKNNDSRIGNTCVSLKGSQYVTLPTVAKLTKEITVNIWAYMDNWASYASNNHRIISCTENGGWNIESASTHNYIEFAIYDKNYGYKSLITEKPWSTLSSGWHMFTLTFDGTYAKGYVDAELLKTSNAFSSGEIGYHASNTIFLGAEAAESSTTPVNGYFNGKIDDLKIYASCLSDEEIKKEYEIRTYLDNLGNLHTSAKNVEDSNVLIDDKGICHADISEGGRALRYIRLYTSGSNKNDSNHITKLSITNIKNKETTLIDAVTNNVSCSVSTTFGWKQNGAISNRYYFDYNVNPITIDIGKIDIIKSINLVRYYADDRYYYGTKVEGSEDNINWFIIYDSHNISSYSSGASTYSYTGSEQTVTLQPGKYKIECWGATGGRSYVKTGVYNGGSGGYSTGTLVLTSATTLYLNVGGKGDGPSTDSSTNVVYIGGYNGGGAGCGAGSGGGATHIATSSGLLSSLSNNKNKIIIVAGGGGGSGSCPETNLWTAGCNGGYGGGLSGTDGISSSDNTRTGGGSGTQSGGGSAGVYKGSSTGASAGAFGKGGNVTYNSSWSNTYRGGAGGGGYYGGGAATQGGAGGGGGSGYINGVSEGSTYNASESGFITNPDASGNGYIKITSLKNNYNAYVETVDGKTFKVDCENAQILPNDNIIIVNEFNKI